MKFNIKNTAAALIFGSAALSASAQFTQSGYFVEDYAYRFLMNPAIANEPGKIFVGVPGVANVNAGIRGNLSLSDVIYNVDGKTVLFSNPGVSSSELMDNLSDMNKIGVSTRVNILSFGFNAFGGYNTINIAARADVNAHIPSSLFSLLKEGVSNRDYEIDGVKARAIGYGEIALGHSRQITPEIRVGASLKVLLGVGSIDAELERATLSLGKDAWHVVTNADIHTSLKGMHYKTTLNDHTNTEYVEGLDGDFSAINGFGLGLDLGAVYTPKALPDWEFSAAILDLGFISWNNDLWASTNGDKAFDSDIYTFNANENADNSFSKEWKKMRNSLEMLYQLDDNGDKGSRTQALNATINLGAAYTLPLYDKLKFGLLNTTRIAGSYSWTDFRLSANVAPVKNVSLGVNTCAGTFGCGFGWMANLRIPGAGIQFFLAQDNFFSKMAKQGVPIASNASVSTGLNVYF